MPIIAEVVAVVLAQAIGAWLLTCLLHGAVMVLLADALERVLMRLHDDAALRATLWRTAIIAPLFTASVHTALPFGSPFRLRTEPAGAVLGPRPELALILVVVWCAFITWRVITFVRAERRARDGFGARAAATDARLLDVAAAYARSAGLRTVPRLTTSTRIVSPVALVPHEICLPVAIFTALTVEQQNALLAHEIAHHARRDPLWCGIASAVTTVCIFQPLNQRALRRLKRATEQAADERALRGTGDPRALAHALAALVPHALNGAPLRVAANGSPLLERIRRILDRAPQPLPMPRWLVLAHVLVVVAVCLAIGPGVNFSPDNAANSIPSLTPSSQPPSPQMMELRTFNQRVRETQRSIARQSVIRR